MRELSFALQMTEGVALSVCLRRHLPQRGRQEKFVRKRKLSRTNQTCLSLWERCHAVTERAFFAQSLPPLSSKPPAEEHTGNADACEGGDWPLEDAGIRQIFICFGGRIRGCWLFIGLIRLVRNIARIVGNRPAGGIFRLYGHGVIPVIRFRTPFRNRDQRRRAGIHAVPDPRPFSDDEIEASRQTGRGRGALAVCRLAGIRRELLALHPSGERFRGDAAIFCRRQVIDICTALFVVGQQRIPPAARGDLRDAVHRERHARERLFAVEVLNREASGFCGLYGFACESVCCQSERGQQAEQ